MKGKEKKRRKKMELWKELKKKFPGLQRIPGRNPVAQSKTTA